MKQNSGILTLRKRHFVSAELINGVRMQRFTPRKKNSPWTELNKERVRRLEKLSLMTDAGRAVLPAMGVRSYKLDADVEAALKQARVYSKFKTFPALYQRTRGYNVSFYKKRAPETYEKMLARLISETKQGKMFGEWKLLSSGLPNQIACTSPIGFLMRINRML